MGSWVPHPSFEAVKKPHYAVSEDEFETGLASWRWAWRN